MPSGLQLAKSDIIALFEQAGPRVYKRPELASVLSGHRTSWQLAQSITTPQFIQLLCREGKLRQIVLKSESNYKPIVRFAWAEVSAYQVALSIRKGAYLSHGTAVFLHGFNDQVPRTIYINSEQSIKPPPKGDLSQASIDRAFSAPQRRSNYVFVYKNHRIVVLSGKHTGRYEVALLRGINGDHLVDGTGPERTLVDIAVRPDYAGGVHQVLAAYRGARTVVSVNKMLAVLKTLDYRYPYHQAIGFYLTRAGYPSARVERFKRLGLDFDFYLAHGIKKPVYDSNWRIWYPEGL